MNEDIIHFSKEHVKDREVVEFSSMPIRFGHRGDNYNLLDLQEKFLIIRHVDLMIVVIDSEHYSDYYYYGDNCFKERGQAMMTVKEIMTDKVLTISKEATLLEAARSMKAQKVGSLLIQEGKEFTGILTETDIVQKSMALDLTPDTTRVEKVMSFPLLTIEAGCSILEATDLMAERFVRHLAVSEKKEVIGIISIRDVLRSEGLPWISIRRLMSMAIFALIRGSTIRDAAKLMRHNKIGSLLVTGRRRQPRAEPFFVGNGKEITGILTETDIVRKVVAEGLDPLTIPVEKAMSRSLTVINSWKRAATACDLMTKNRIRHLPVTEGQKIIGMVSIRDLINPLYYAHGGLQYEHQYR